MSMSSWVSLAEQLRAVADRLQLLDDEVPAVPAPFYVSLSLQPHPFAGDATGRLVVDAVARVLGATPRHVLASEGRIQYEVQHGDPWNGAGVAACYGVQHPSDELRAQLTTEQEAARAQRDADRRRTQPDGDPR